MTPHERKLDTMKLCFTHKTRRLIKWVSTHVKNTWGTNALLQWSPLSEAVSANAPKVKTKSETVWSREFWIRNTQSIDTLHLEPTIHTRHYTFLPFYELIHYFFSMYLKANCREEYTLPYIVQQAEYVLERKTRSWIHTEATHTANFTTLECRGTKLWQRYNPHPYQATEYNHHSTVILCVPSRWAHCHRQSALLAYRTEIDSCNLTKGLISNWLKQLTALLILSVEMPSLSTYSLPHTEQARDNVIIISLN